MLQSRVERQQKVWGQIKFSANSRNLQFECARILHQELLMSALIYESETIVWRKKERFIIRPIQMDNLRYLLGIRRRAEHTVCTG